MSQQREFRPVKIETAEIFNPKQETDVREDKEDRLFPYYAGYSKRFAAKLLRSLELKPTTVVFDPWNGSGTTTRAASELKHQAVGCDLNPVMVLIAKADLIASSEAPAITPLASEIGARALARQAEPSADDPLCKWLVPNSAWALRSIERQINRTLVNGETHVPIAELHDFSSVAPLAAVMYLALFRATRRLLSGFLGSNPTWIKAPSDKANRLRPAGDLISALFNAEAAYLASRIAARSPVEENEIVAKLYRANSSKVPLDNKSVDLVLTSPPYCTRIDYAMATSIELAVLGVGSENFDKLRRSLLGNATVGPDKIHEPNPMWGETCLQFLEALRGHPSRASAGYYYKNHLQYFSGLSDSIREIARVMRPDAVCVATVQDSHYKELHNDLPLIFGEMCASHGMAPSRRVDFASGRSMANINSKSLQYRTPRRTTESVLAFQAK
jgi:SAM-dependent methyltransferase